MPQAQQDESGTDKAQHGKCNMAQAQQEESGTAKAQCGKCKTAQAQQEECHKHSLSTAEEKARLLYPQAGCCTNRTT
jgi:hypothetical protein